MSHIKLGVVPSGESFVQTYELSVNRKPSKEGAGYLLALKYDKVPRLLVHVMPELNAARARPDDAIRIRRLQRQGFRFNTRCISRAHARQEAPYPGGGLHRLHRRVSEAACQLDWLPTAVNI